MKAQTFKHFKESQLRFIINAVSLERMYLTDEQKILLDIGYSKLVLDRNHVELDTMEMILLSQALKSLSVRLYEKYGDKAHKDTRKKLLDAASNIDSEIIQHQKKHHPLKNSLKKHKKILTA